MKPRPVHLSLALVTLAALLFAAGCGDSSTDKGQTTTGTASERQSGATTVPPPPGSSAQSCGNTTVRGTSGLRVTGVGCPTGRGIVAVWARTDTCSADVSRPACTVDHGYRCIGARTTTGIAVACARPGQSISFLAKRN